MDSRFAQSKIGAEPHDEREADERRQQPPRPGRVTGRNRPFEPDRDGLPRRQLGRHPLLGRRRPLRPARRGGAGKTSRGLTSRRCDRKHDSKNHIIVLRPVPIPFA